MKSPVGISQSRLFAVVLLMAAAWTIFLDNHLHLLLVVQDVNSADSKQEWREWIATPKHVDECENDAESNIDNNATWNLENEQGVVSEYASEREQSRRPCRFPSVQERVRVYMGNWYSPPCEDNIDGHVEFQLVRNNEGRSDYIVKEMAFNESRRRVFLAPGDLNDTERELTVFHIDSYATNKTHLRKNNYWVDSKKYLVPAFERGGGKNKNAPTLVQYGVEKKTAGYDPVRDDRRVYFPIVPWFRRCRQSFTRAEIDEMAPEKCISGTRQLPVRYPTFQPLIAIYRENLHFGPCRKVPSVDIPWSEKKNMAVFRGADTGRDNPDLDESSLSERDKCLLNRPRCRMIYNHVNSSLVDAKYRDKAMENGMPNVIDGRILSDKGMTMEKQLKYKALIMLEGHDIATGIKWALYSNSVVMAQWPVKYTSWAMEELLEPWVHFIPVNDDLGDIEEKMQWIIDNDKEAQNIAYRGSLWMKDFMFHPDSNKDTLLIHAEMVRRYRAHFIEKPNIPVQARAQL